MTQSPRAVAREALRRARGALPARAAKFARHDFTDHPPFALLARKTFLASYRGVVALLDTVPHYATRGDAAGRLLTLQRGSSTEVYAYASASRPARPRSAAGDT